ncbi:putative ribonuclease H-like domain-containing protein [Tanacetum coccineum]
MLLRPQQDNPHKNKDLRIIDSGCSRSMTGNKEKLDEFVKIIGVDLFGSYSNQEAIDHKYYFLLVTDDLSRTMQKILVGFKRQEHEAKDQLRSMFWFLKGHRGTVETKLIGFLLGFLGDLASPVQTRGKLMKSKFGESTLVSYVHDQQRTKSHRLFTLSVCLLSYPNLNQVVLHKLLMILIGLRQCKRRCNSLFIRRLVAQGHRQEEGIDYDEVFAPVARIEAIRLFLAFASYMGFMVYQMDVKSAFLYGEIDKEVYVTQPKGFEDPHFPKHLYKVVKALYGLHQRLSAISRNKYVYVDDIIFGSINQAWCDEFKVLMKGEFEMSAMGELTFFLGLQVKQNPDGIFISQDKYVKDMLKKFDMENVRPATTPFEASKPKSKDEPDDAINVHLYRSMIGSLMYLTALRPDIQFAVSACSRHQVTPLTSNLNAVKKIFKYLKGQPKLGLWYPRDSPFVLEAYSDSDYAGSHGDRKSTTGGCQFLGRRLISWQCKKQTIMATSSTEAEYVAAASCCGQVSWDHLEANWLLLYLSDEERRGTTCSLLATYASPAQAAIAAVFKEVVGKLVKRVKLLEDKLKGRKRKFVLTDSDKEENAELDVDPLIKLAKTAATAAAASAVPTGGSHEAGIPPSSSIPTDEFAGGSDVPDGATTGLSTVFPSSTTVSTPSFVLACETSSCGSDKTFKQLEEERLGWEAAQRLQAQELADFEKQRAESLMKDANLARQMSQDFEKTEAKDESQQEFMRCFASASMVDVVERLKERTCDTTHQECGEADTVSAQAMRTYVKNQGPAVYSTGWTMAQVRKLSPEQLQEEFDKIQRALQFQGFQKEMQSNDFLCVSSKKLRLEVAAPSHSQDIPDAQVKVPSNTTSTAQHTASSLKKVGTRNKRLGRKGVHISHSTIPIKDGDPEVEHKMCIKYASDADSASDDDTPVNFYGVVDWELLPTGLGLINVLYRKDNSRKCFTSLREILYLVTRADLMTIYGRVMTFYQDKKAAGIGLVLWGDLKVLMDSPEVNDVNGLVVHMFVDKKYPLSVNLIERMLDHPVEICQKKDVVVSMLTVHGVCIWFQGVAVQSSGAFKDRSILKLEVNRVKFKFRGGLYVVPTCHDNVLVSTGRTKVIH